MADHKNIDRICIIIGIVTILIGFVFSYFGESIGITAGTADLSYVTKLFDDSTVHTIDIEISEEDWNNIQENASEEEYELCAVTVDGEKLDNVAIRPKGNSSLSSVVSSDSERYSFKIDFDRYTDGLSYHGLDKLNLNNIISDNTYLKEYLSYDMMAYMGVDAPLTSFVKVSVNGEYFGLYLGVEGIEDAFAQRNYGSDYGNIYKPDSMQIGGDNEMGGGDGEMPDMNNMPDMNQGTDTDQTTDTTQPDATQRPTMGQPPDASQMPDGGQALGDLQTDDGTQTTDAGNQMPDMSQTGNMGGSSGNDVALIYSDDELSSYENIWEGAVFDVTASDKETLIDSIRQLNEGENLEEVVDVEEVLKYFVVHNFVDNYDSYTGSMKHNYYLREDDGQMSIIAWDYNLAFSNFSGGGMGGGTAKTVITASTDEATTLVNYPIDTPVSGTTMEERPLLNALLSNEAYMDEYHEYYQEFISGYFESGQYEETIDNAVALISEYVKDDPTAFCTYEEYEEGVTVLKQFCELRAESISGQLDGTIPSTTTGQTEQVSALIDASAIDVSVMGSNMMGGGMDNGAALQNNPAADTAQTPEITVSAETTTGTETTADKNNNQKPSNATGGGQPPTGMVNGDTATAVTTTETADGTESTAETANQIDQASFMPDTENGDENGRNHPTESTGMNWDMSSIILLGVSCFLLVGGLLATKLYKR